MKYKNYNIVKGSYKGTTDNRSDRYYIDLITSSVIDHRGRGFSSVTAAKNYVEMLEILLDEAGGGDLIAVEDGY